MVATTIHSSASLRIEDYRCQAGVGAPVQQEEHRGHSVSFVRTGSFGYRTGGRAFELVAGSVLIGRPGDEYTCSHDHVCGDECLSFFVGPACLDEIGGAAAIWAHGALPPISALMVAAELAQACVDGRSATGIDEAGLLFVARFAAVAEGQSRHFGPVSARDRSRAVAAALWIEENLAEDIRLDQVAGLIGLSAYHFLRLFLRVTGVTPHQYLVRSRLRRAARLLIADHASITNVAYDAGFNDVSNFIRTFRGAAGVSPRRFRTAAKHDRKFVQDSVAA